MPVKFSPPFVETMRGAGSSGTMSELLSAGAAGVVAQLLPNTAVRLPEFLVSIEWGRVVVSLRNE
jgi:hypothetical protein